MVRPVLNPGSRQSRRQLGALLRGVGGRHMGSDKAAARLRESAAGRRRRDVRTAAQGNTIWRADSASQVWLGRRRTGVEAEATSGAAQGGVRAGIIRGEGVRWGHVVLAEALVRGKPGRAGTCFCHAPSDTPNGAFEALRM